jgi:hypothetical protein
VPQGLRQVPWGPASGLRRAEELNWDVGCNRELKHFGRRCSHLLCPGMSDLRAGATCRVLLRRHSSAAQPFWKAISENLSYRTPN